MLSFSLVIYRIIFVQLLEYFRMINFVRPGVFGHQSEAIFERDYMTPIMNGLTSDAADSSIIRSLRMSKKLNTFLEPYIQRKDASVLREFLPPISQVVLHVRPTKMQTKLYRRYKRHKNASGDNNFLKHYAALVRVKCLSAYQNRFGHTFSNFSLIIFSHRSKATRQQPSRVPPLPTANQRAV